MRTAQRGLHSNPVDIDEFATVLKVAKALGVRLHAHAAIGGA